MVIVSSSGLKSSRQSETHPTVRSCGKLLDTNSVQQFLTKCNYNCNTTTYFVLQAKCWLAYTTATNRIQYKTTPERIIQIQCNTQHNTMATGTVVAVAMAKVSVVKRDSARDESYDGGKAAAVTTLEPRSRPKSSSSGGSEDMTSVR